MSDEDEKLIEEIAPVIRATWMRFTGGRGEMQGDWSTVQQNLQNTWRLIAHDVLVAVASAKARGSGE